ncbi:MAG: triphosphoribosyl-dephospho-CoA synthase [Candidatus Izemoplasmatales bacterium]|nr:triphosphoribosyl-dephospho-CoA synthase [Candidatus Izemoplasmatales bacterium]
MPGSFILRDREKKASMIMSLLSIYKIVISVKANTPGHDKKNVSSFWLVSIFANQLSFEDEDRRELIVSEDGPYMLIMLKDGVGKTIKDKMIELEESSSLGRLIDIDVYELNNEYHRAHPRRCLLCENIAFECRRLNLHTTEQLIQKTNQIFLESVKAKLLEIINKSMLLELTLEPKFGLVTPNSSGSHKDMNYDLMIKAKDAILPYFSFLFETSFLWKDSLTNLRKEIRTIGLEAEKSMLVKTNGINAYKGLIFNLGFVLAALGQVMASKKSFNEIFDLIKVLGYRLTDELNGPVNSYGTYAFKEMHIAGARKEMEEGLPNVKDALELFKADDNNLLEVLVYFIKLVEDTTLLKRAGSLSKYNEVKENFYSLDIYNFDQVDTLSKWCIKENLTFGGSADLLVVFIFLSKTKKWLF